MPSLKKDSVVNALVSKIVRKSPNLRLLRIFGKKCGMK